MGMSSADGHEFMEPEEWESWAAVMMLHRAVLQDIDTELRQEHKLAITEFDVLITLFNAPGNRLGMSALARQAMLSPAGTTHLVTRLERDGLVKREVDPADRRKWFTVLTEEGDQTLRAARRTHNAVLRRTFLNVTSPADRKMLRRLWQRLSSSRPGAGSRDVPGRARPRAGPSPPDGTRLLSAAHGRWLAENLPDARLVMREGEGHFGIMEHLAEMLDALTAPDPVYPAGAG